MNRGTTVFAGQSALDGQRRDFHLLREPEHPRPDIGKEHPVVVPLKERLAHIFFQDAQP